MVLIAAGISITIVAVVGTIGTELNATYSGAALRGLTHNPPQPIGAFLRNGKFKYENATEAPAAAKTMFGRSSGRRPNRQGAQGNRPARAKRAG
jgi:hypothetical protein